jgi:hypothetical protein
MATYRFLRESGSGCLLRESAPYPNGSGYLIRESGVTSIRVQAVAPGFYGRSFRNVGDVFDITPEAFSDSTVSLVPIGNPDYPLYGWMLQVASTTPLSTYSLSTGQGLSDPYQSVMGVDSAGHPLWSIPRTVV